MLRRTLSIVLCVQYLLAAHCTDTLLVSTCLAVVWAHLMYFCTAYSENKKAQLKKIFTYNKISSWSQKMCNETQVHYYDICLVYYSVQWQKKWAINRCKVQ